MGKIVGFTVLLAAVVAAAMTLWWYRSVPHDLALARVEVGRISDYPDLDWTYGPKHAAYVARISFTSSGDFRAAMTADRARDESYGFALSAAQCGCDEDSIRDRKGGCGAGDFDLYDRYGRIDRHAEHANEQISSEAGAGPMTYHTYVNMTPWTASEGPFDFVHKPADICLTVTRYGAAQINAGSNTVRVPKDDIAAAVARARLR